MHERTVTRLKAVQGSFFLLLFLFLVLSSNSFAGTFMFSPATQEITCYDDTGNVLPCPSDVLTYIVPETEKDTVTGNYSSLPFIFLPATHQISYYDKWGNIVPSQPARLTDTLSGGVTATDNYAGLSFIYAPARFRIACFDGPGSAILCPPGVAALWHAPTTSAVR